MSYVPPHKRLDSSSPRPTPAVPPFSSRTNTNRSNHNDRGGFKPDVNIKYARNSIRRWFPVGEGGNPSDVLLEFQRFEGGSFEHLRDEKLYTIFPIPRHVRDVEDDLGSLTIEETSPWRYIWEEMKEDFKEAYHNVLSYMETTTPDDVKVKPTFVVRFGRVLFHGDGLSWHASINSDFVEKTLNKTGFQSPLKKTFETNISENVCDALKEKIIVGSETQKLSEKEKYLIQVEDKLRPGFILHLSCRKSSADEKKLELKKIELAPMRHLVADVSCFNKPMDLRMILTTEKYWTEEESMEYIEKIVKSASIEGSAKGGLHWPLGGDSEDRISVRGAWHLNVTSLVGENCKIKFQRANRAEFKASSGRLTTETTFKLKSVTKYLRDQTEWEEEKIMNMLENFLKWVWTECLECDKLVQKDEH